MTKEISDKYIKILIHDNFFYDNNLLKLKFT